MSTDSLLGISKLLLPEVLIDYFELTKHEIKDDEIHFYFTELNTIPNEFKGIKLHSKVSLPKLLYKILYEERKYFYI
ncbi:MAG: hypothetical protein V3U92_00420 [Cellulophaga sp.]